MYSLELTKIYNNSGFSVYLFGTLVVLISIFIVNVRIDEGYIRNHVGDKLVEEYSKDLAETEDKIRKMKTKEYKDNLYKIAGKSIPVEEWNDEMKDSYAYDLEMENYVLERIRDQLNKHKIYLKNYNSDTSEEFYLFEKDNISKEFEIYTYQYNDRVKLTGKSIKYNQRLYQKAAENNTKAVFGNGIYVSPYEKFENNIVKEDIMKNAFKKDHDAFYFLYRMFKNNNFDIILLIVIVLMTMNGFTNDKEYGNQFEFMNLQPISKTKLLLTKIFSQIIAAIGVITLITGVMFIIGGLKSGFGTYNYPVANYSEGGYKFISLWMYLLKIMILLFVISMFISSLMTLISIFTKNKNSLYTITAVVVATGLAIDRYLPDNLKAYNSFNYFKANLVADNSLGLIREIPNTNYLMSIIILLVSSLVCILIANVSINNKEVA